MEDRELEDLLRRYRPAGPPPELRARVTLGGDVRMQATASLDSRRAWPWAAAAAALLAVTTSLYDSSAHLQSEVIPRRGAAAARLAYVADQLEEIGEDPGMARLIVAEEERDRMFAQTTGAGPEAR